MRKFLLSWLACLAFSGAASAATVLSPGTTIYPGQLIQSQNGQFSFGIDPTSHLLMFYFQYAQDGDYTTAYEYLSPNYGWEKTGFVASTFWPTENKNGPGQTSGHVVILNEPGDHLVMQGDGNLVLYNGNTAIWDTGTGGHPGAYAVIENFGDIGIYLPGSTQPMVEWPYPALTSNVSDSVHGAPSSFFNEPRINVYTSFLASSDDICGGTFYVASVTQGNTMEWCGIFSDTVTMQADGNLVFYRNGTNVLQSGTAGYNGDMAVFSPVGILISKPQGGIDNYMPYPLVRQEKWVPPTSGKKPPTVNESFNAINGFLSHAQCYVTSGLTIDGGGGLACYGN
jgi:hypothetical protein